ncbi:hypothetical protein VCHA53O466_320028 [Vibrio chagasii]|nr:hypothetical protein VCHA53O466_320028 [Vibrio chagasii]
MTTIYTLPPRNQYYVAYLPTEIIRFHKDGELLESEVCKGWLGSNHVKISGVDDAPVSTRNKVETGLKAGGHFFTKKDATLYIDVNVFDDFEELGEVYEHTNDKGTKCYLQKVSITAKFEGITKPAKREFSISPYTRYEYTGRGKVEKDLKDKLREMKSNNRVSDVLDAMSKDPEAFIKILSQQS